MQDSTIESVDESLAERLKVAIGERSARAFAKKIGVSEGTMRNILNGQSLKLDTLVSIAKETGYSLNWLATGEGPRTLQADDIAAWIDLLRRINGDANAWQRFDKKASEIGAVLGDFVLIPALNTPPTGRNAIGEFFSRDYVQSRGLQEDQLCVVYAIGDSMEGEINSEATMLIDKSDLSLRDGNIYVICIDGQMYAKRVQRDVDGSVNLLSENKAYSPIEVAIERLGKLQVVGRVVWSDREH